MYEPISNVQHHSVLIKVMLVNTFDILACNELIIFFNAKDLDNYFAEVP